MTLTQPFYNVRDFGAKGDDTTDDLDAFKKALDTMKGDGGSRGSILLIPPGTYKLDGTLEIGLTCIIQGCGSHLEGTSTELHFKAKSQHYCLFIWGQK